MNWGFAYGNIRRWGELCLLLCVMRRGGGFWLRLIVGVVRWRFIMKNRGGAYFRLVFTVGLALERSYGVYLTSSYATAMLCRPFRAMTIWRGYWGPLRFYTVAPSGLLCGGGALPRVSFMPYGMGAYPGLYTVAPSGLCNSELAIGGVYWQTLVVNVSLVF